MNKQVIGISSLLMSSFFDSIPRLQIGNDVVKLAERLKRYEYVLIALPVALVLIGGALGGVIGGVAAF